MLTFKKVIKVYFINTSILAHFLLLVMIVLFIFNTITSHWRWPYLKHWVLGEVDSSEVYSVAYNDFSSLPKRKWLKIHQQKADDRVHFVRQMRAGSAFDPVRSRIILFGSNTRGENWNNTIYSFNLNKLLWAEAYKPDFPDTYSVNSKGIPVAGSKKNHPWAMQTHAAIAFDEKNGSLIVASYPGHLAPNKLGANLKSIWKSIDNHPLWNYDFQLKKWLYFDSNNINFYLNSIVYNPDRKLITGFNQNGIFEWHGIDNGWNKIANNHIKQFHTNVVYDSSNQVFILFGGNKLDNRVHTFKVGDKSTKVMSTLGKRPPGGQSIPLAFHEGKNVMVALIDDKIKSQTWLYDYYKDEWQHLSNMDFPYAIGMNYSMEYDPKNKLIVLVSNPKYEQTAVWVLRL